MKHDDWRFLCLKQIADALACRFMCEFYLVGSYIEKGEGAADIDIIMVADEDRIKRLFGSLNWNKKWQHLYFKQKKNIEQSIRDMDIDFKVQSYKQFNAVDSIRYKLDSIIPERDEDEL